MTDQQKIAAILNAIQTQSNLIILLQAMIANNIGNVSSVQLDTMMALLGLSES